MTAMNAPHVLVEAFVALALLAGCAATPAPGQDAGRTSPRVLGYGAFMPQCVVLCFATGQSSQADRAAEVQAGNLTTHRTTSRTSTRTTCGSAPAMPAKAKP